MQLTNGKYFSTIGLGFLSEIEDENFTMTPYIKLFVGILSENGEKVYLDSKDVKLPTSLEAIGKEFESLIFKIENPDFDDEIAY